jgi:hypothetical protein
MTGGPRPKTVRWWSAVATAAVVTAALAALSAATHPFTPGAEAATALPVAIGLVAVGLTLRRDPTVPVLAPDDGGASPEARRRWSQMWLGLVATTVAWEVYCFLSSPRSAHPTLSVLLDMLDATWSGKFVAFSLWLALGWYLVTR